MVDLEACDDKEHEEEQDKAPEEVEVGNYTVAIFREDPILMCI